MQYRQLIADLWAQSGAANWPNARRAPTVTESYVAPPLPDGTFVVTQTLQVSSGGPGCCCGVCVDWDQVFADNGPDLFMTLPCANTPGPYQFTYVPSGVPGVQGSYVGVGTTWGLCAEDFNPIYLSCESHDIPNPPMDPLSNTPQITGNHGGNVFRVPITIISLNPFLATFTVLPFDAGNTNSNEPCGGCGEPAGMDGTITP